MADVSKSKGALESPSANAAAAAQKQKDVAANQNRLLQSMLNDKTTADIKKKQDATKAVNDTYYEQWLAGYKTLKMRLEGAKDSYSQGRVQEEINNYIAKLDDKNSDITRDGLLQYLAYTNQTDKYRDLVLRTKEKPTVKVDYSRSRYDAYNDPVTYTASGALANFTTAQIKNIQSAQEAYKLAVDIAKQINAVMPNAIATNVIGYEKNVATGEQAPVYGYTVVKSDVRIKQLADLLKATNAQLVKLLNAEAATESKTMKKLGANNVSSYSAAVSTSNYNIEKIVSNLIAAQYRAFYLTNKYNSDAAMYNAPEGYDFSKDENPVAQRIAKESIDADNATEIANNMFMNISNLQLTDDERKKLYLTYYTKINDTFGRYISAGDREKINNKIKQYTNTKTAGLINGQINPVSSAVNNIINGGNSNGND